MQFEKYEHEKWMQKTNPWRFLQQKTEAWGKALGVNSVCNYYFESKQLLIAVFLDLCLWILNTKESNHSIVAMGKKGDRFALNLMI